MKKIENNGERTHSKASERYVDVIFEYKDGTIWNGSIPIEYRRTGVELTEQEDIEEYIKKAYDYCHPNNYQSWKQEQKEFWLNKAKAKITKEIFEVLTTFEWTCVSCQLPANPNFARRIQDLKEMGYTIATDTTKRCNTCDSKKTHLILVPLPRGGVSGYEVWSPSLRKKIVDLLNGYDAYEGKIVKKDNLLPDHKFPEIRWGRDTKRDSLEKLTDKEITEQFQLLSNQRNLQKREVCRQCYQTGIRGYPFGIKYYYQGEQTWSSTIPRSGKAAEKGCLGCGWYDLESWRTSLNSKLAESS
jgi:hypothetical protein